MSKAATTFERKRATPKPTLLICLLLFLALVLVLLAASVIGSERLPISPALQAVLTGGQSVSGLTPEQRAILFDIRLPRILLAAAVGMSLAAAGAGYQSL